MSTSEPRPLQLIDLSGPLPPRPGDTFTEQTSFERFSTATPPPPSPEESYRNGLAEGEQRGRAAALKELEPVIQELRQLGQAMAGIRAQRLADAESALVDVATRTAERILHGELAQPGDVVLRLARACIQEAAADGPLVLRACPSDLDLLRTHLPELELDLAEGEITIRAEPALAPGNVVLETRTRCYDGRPERILGAARARCSAAPEAEA